MNRSHFHLYNPCYSEGVQFIVHNNSKGKRKMTTQQAIDVAGSISANESRDVNELSDQEICGYLVDAGHEETPENIALVRSV